MTNTGFITDALNAFAESTSSFSTAFEDIESFRFFLSEFGWQLDPNIDEAGFAKVLEAFAIEIALLEQMDGGDPQRAIAAPGLIASLMNGRTADASWPAPLKSSLFWSEFPLQLLDSFIWQMIQGSSSLSYALLRFGAVFKEVEQDAVEAAGSEPSRLSYLKRSIDWEQFVNFLADPENAFKTAYSWNSSTDNFSAEALLKAIGAMFEMLPVASVVMDAPALLYDKYFDSSLPTSPEKIEMLTVMPYMLRDSNGAPIDLLKVSLNAVPIPGEGTNTGSPCGIVIFPIISGSAQSSLSLGEGITLQLSGNYSSTPVNAEIRPGAVAIELPGVSATSLSASAKVEAENEASPWVIIGSSDGPRFEVSKAHVELAATGTIQNPVFAIKTALDKATVVIDFSSSDGFLQNVFGDSPQRINVELTVGWSTQGGFRISGGAVLDLTIPVHETLFNAITIDCVKIKMGTDAADLKTHFNAGVVANLKLGLINVSVDNVGLKLGLKPTIDGSGNIGIFDVSLGFLPPTGAGLSVSAGPVIGGGYLECDNANKRYAGLLGLKFEKLSLAAVALITTRMPDGSKGYSMLVNLGVTFAPPVLLPYNFTLSGVGGVIGINRSMSVDALRDGLVNQTLDSILFPDPATIVENADKTISDMRTVFPPTEGRYVVGPMVKLGWGQKNIITADIGIFLELPAPVEIVILGKISAMFPDPQNAVVVLNIDVLGVWDIPQKKIAIDSTIYNSRIYTYALAGDAALLLCYGNNPNFVMSIGGFHPRFSAPPDIRSLRQLSLTIRRAENFVVTLRGYYALTTNTLQFGARVDLYAKYSGAICTGMLSFDAIIYFSPFSFDTNISGNVVVRYRGKRLAGVWIRLDFQGPRPWSVNGEITVEIFCWDVTVSINKTWGSSTEITLPAVNPWSPLLKALSERSSWSASLPANTHAYEMLADLEVKGDDPPIIVHPAGTLEIRQNVLPFDVHLQKLGNSPVKEFTYFDISKVTLEGKDLTLEDLEEDFAPGQFKTLSDPLTAPSFEKMKAGVAVTSDQIKFSDDKIYDVDHEFESRLIADDRTSSKAHKTGKLLWETGVLQLGRAVHRKRQSAVSMENFFKDRSKTNKVATQKETYWVVNKADLKTITSNEALSSVAKLSLNGALGYTGAGELLEACVAADPSLAGKLDIVEFYEEVA